MSMQVEIERWFDSGEPKLHSDGDGGLVMETKATAPPSRVGKTVYVHIDRDMVTRLLLELRKQAIQQRR